MRQLTDATKLERFLQELGRHARSAGTIYLVGGASAVRVGWRATTVDIDLKLDPEPAGVFGVIGRLKDELDLNVELASPDMFIPPVPGWKERSVFVDRFGSVEVYHFDFVSPALSKDRCLGRRHHHVRPLACPDNLIIDPSEMDYWQLPLRVYDRCRTTNCGI